MVSSRRNTVQKLRYKVQYNATDNTIEVTYSFTTDVLEDGGTVVRIEPHVRTLRYGRKQRGRKKDIDWIYDDRKRMAELTKKAEQYFSEIIGPAIDATIQVSMHQALFKAGLKLKETPAQLATTLAQAERRNFAQELGTKRGAPKGVKHKQRHSFTKKTFPAALQQKIRELWYEGDKPTRLAVARALGLENAKTLDRLRKQFDDRPWKEILNEAMEMN